MFILHIVDTTEGSGEELGQREQAERLMVVLLTRDAKRDADRRGFRVQLYIMSVTTLTPLWCSPASSRPILVPSCLTRMAVGAL